VEDRKKIIQEKLKKEEQREIQQLSGIKQMIWEILIQEKGFQPEDIQVDPLFTITIDKTEAFVTVDFIINLSSINFMVIRCAASTMESWERYILAFARVAGDYQIPYAAVTDGETARIFDVDTGSVIGESIESIFTKDEALYHLKNVQKIPYSPQKREKEQRILYAFEGIKCPPSK
jgi:hypothetical protein